MKNRSFFHVNIQLTQHYLLIQLSFLHCSEVSNCHKSVAMDMEFMFGLLVLVVSFYILTLLMTIAAL